MRRTLHSLPIILVTLSLPSFAAQPEAPKPSSTHIIQIIRSGPGQPRVRDASAATPASLRTHGQAEVAGRTRPYQPTKPGEGEPKN